MANRGGKRDGSGRKPFAIEQKVSERMKAILSSIYDGDEDEAIRVAWNSGEPTLMKFILAHAYGNPTDNINLSGGITNTVEYDMSKLDTNTLKNLVNAATTDKSS